MPLPFPGTRRGSSTGGFAELGDELRDWWGPERRPDRRRGGSLSSSGSGPKTPVLSNHPHGIPPTNNSTTIAEESDSPVLPRRNTNSSVPPSSPVSPRQNNIQFTSSSSSPLPSPVLLSRPGTGFFSTVSRQSRQSTVNSPVFPPAAVVRDSVSPEYTSVGVQRIQAGVQSHHGDVEAQQNGGGPATKGPRWWWQKADIQGLRTRLMTVLISGLFLAISLSIYLAVALTNNVDFRQERHVLLILIILLATMLFCHSLVRLCMLASQYPNHSSHSASRSSNLSRVPSVVGPGGYANPVVPIIINPGLSDNDSDAESDAAKLPPPVYGLWRCSVRVNPDQFYWARRNDAAAAAATTGNRNGSILEEVDDSRPTAAAAPSRPPSYDGIAYLSTEQQQSHPPLPSTHDHLLVPPPYPQ